MRLWPTTLLVAIGAGAAAIAGHHRWAGIVDSARSVSADPRLAVIAPAADAPAVTALALVVLAAWGVLLVTRGWFRRAIAILAALAALGLLAAAIDALLTVRHTVRAAYHTNSVDVGFGVWPFIALAGAIVAVVATLLGVWHGASWPEMGRKYDAPTQPAAPIVVPLEEQSALDVWKAMDEGHDPTSDGPSPASE